MKKLLVIIAILAGVGHSYAQTNLQTTQLQARWLGMTTSTPANCIVITGRPVTNHIFTFNPSVGSATTSAVLVTVTGSTDGGSSFSSVGTSTATAGGTITPTTAIYTNLCIVLTSMTASGVAAIDATYSGIAVGSGGAVTISGSAAITAASGSIASGAISANAFAAGSIRDGADVAQGTTTDAKCLTTDATACTLVALNKAVSANTATIAGAVVPVSTACAIVSTISTNSVGCKGSAGFRTGLWVVNTTATVYYLRLYNASSAPTCSSATGFIQSIPIPASTSGAGITFQIPNSVAFSTGLGYCITASSTSTANDNAAAGIFGELYYN